MNAQERFLAICEIKDEADVINQAADDGDELAKDVIGFYNLWYNTQDAGNEELENKILAAYKKWKDSRNDS